MSSPFVIVDYTKEIYEGDKEKVIEELKKFNKGVLTLPREYLQYIQGVYKVEDIKCYDSFSDREYERYKDSVIVSRS